MTDNNRTNWSAKAVALARGRPLVTAVVSLFVGALIGVGAAGASSDVETLRGDLSLITAENAGLEQENFALSSENSELSAELQGLTEDVSSLQEELELLRSQKALPTLVGLTLADARNTARANDWHLEVSKRVSTEPPGTIIGQTPAAGSLLASGDAVGVTVAKAPPPPPEPEPEVDEPSESGSVAGCTLGYSPCLPPAPDYDCLGGSGDGPKYTGTVTVTGSDPYGLDDDNDGVGCE